MDATNKNPVVVNVGTLTTTQQSSTIQRVAFVSAKETIIPVVDNGVNTLPNIVEVTATTYLDYFSGINQENDVALKVKSYFSQNPSGTCYLFETGTLQYPVTVLNNYVDSGDSIITWYVLSNFVANGGIDDIIRRRLDADGALDGDFTDDGTQDWGAGVNIDNDIDNDGNQDWGNGVNIRPTKKWDDIFEPANTDTFVNSGSATDGSDTVQYALIYNEDNTVNVVQDNNIPFNLATAYGLKLELKDNISHRIAVMTTVDTLDMNGVGQPVGTEILPYDATNYPAIAFGGINNMPPSTPITRVYVYSNSASKALDVERDGTGAIAMYNIILDVAEVVPANYSTPPTISTHSTAELDTLTILSQKLESDAYRQKLVMEFDFTDGEASVNLGFDAVKGTGGSIVFASNTITNPLLPNGNRPFSLVGLFAGEIGSPRMTINDINGNKAMQYRLFIANKPTTRMVSNIDQTFYVENFIGYGSLPIANAPSQGAFINAYFQNGITFDAIWGSLNVNELIDIALTTMIQDSANKRGSQLFYNQVGIDKVSAKVKNILITSRNLGLINEFYSGYDSTSNVGVGSDSINTVPYSTYIKQNPSHKPQGLYTGISFFMDSAGFIIKLEINAGLII